MLLSAETKQCVKILGMCSQIVGAVRTLTRYTRSQGQEKVRIDSTAEISASVEKWKSHCIGIGRKRKIERENKYRLQGNGRIIIRIALRSGRAWTEDDA